MKKNMILNRRSLLMGTGTLTAMALLTACGGGGGNTTSAESAGIPQSGADINDLVQINAQDVSTLKQGGELNLPVSSIGPDFNTSTQTGNSSDTNTVISTFATNMVTGIWRSDFDGTTSVNPDFCESYESETVDGKQTIRIKLNPKAKFNDGTPINVDTLKLVAKIRKDVSGPYNIVTSGMYEYVESVEADGDDYTAVVTMSRPYYPADSLFGSLYHPALEDPEVFNNGFNDNPNPDWCIGPFKLDEWNSTEKRLSVVPNENWWGDKPLLDRINFRQMEASAARAAFKNGEIDAVGARTLTAYKEVENTADTEPRRALRLFAGGLNLNPARITDVALRKAIFAATDRKVLSELRFQGLNWAEEVPGSMVLLPISEHYNNNFPSASGAEAAKKILTDAGYTEANGFMEKDGKKASFKITTFGDDPVNQALSQTLIEQMKAAGIEASIDNQPDANFAKVVGNEEYDMTFSGFSVGSDATTATRQFYHSANQTDGAAGSPEIDAMIEEMEGIEDDAQRNAKCNEIEKKFMEEFATLGTVFNGPDIMFAKKQLANYGAAMYGSPVSYPQRWSQVGWMN